MATNPLPERRRHDTQALSEQVHRITQALNAGGANVNLASGNRAAVMNQFYPFRMPAMAFASLPAPDDAGAGARALVTDSQVSTTDGIGTIISEGGGIHPCPVYSTGNYWHIG